jgi:hypothetical protein
MADWAVHSPSVCAYVAGPFLTEHLFRWRGRVPVRVLSCAALVDAVEQLAPAGLFVSVGERSEQRNSCGKWLRDMSHGLVGDVVCMWLEQSRVICSSLLGSVSKPFDLADSKMEVDLLHDVRPLDDALPLGLDVHREGILFDDGAYRSVLLPPLPPGLNTVEALARRLCATSDFEYREETHRSHLRRFSVRRFHCSNYDAIRLAWRRSLGPSFCRELSEFMVGRVQENLLPLQVAERDFSGVQLLGLRHLGSEQFVPTLPSVMQLLFRPPDLVKNAALFADLVKMSGESDRVVGAVHGFIRAFMPTGTVRNGVGVTVAQASSLLLRPVMTIVQKQPNNKPASEASVSEEARAYLRDWCDAVGIFLRQWFGEHASGRTSLIPSVALSVADGMFRARIDLPQSDVFLMRPDRRCGVGMLRTMTRLARTTIADRVTWEPLVRTWKAWWAETNALTLSLWTVPTSELVLAFDAISHIPKSHMDATMRSAYVRLLAAICRRWLPALPLCIGEWDSRSAHLDLAATLACSSML